MKYTAHLRYFANGCLGNPFLILTAPHPFKRKFFDIFGNANVSHTV